MGSGNALRENINRMPYDTQLEAANSSRVEIEE
jgi:hypothetical protein